MEMGWTTFNDRLALGVMSAIIGLWILNHWYTMPGEVLGATIAVFTLVSQYYFRKAPDNPAATKEQ